MEAKQGQNTPLDYVSVISDTMFRLQFIEEFLNQELIYSQPCYVGMSVVVRDSFQQLEHARDFFLEHFNHPIQDLPPCDEVCHPKASDSESLLGTG